MKKLIAFSPLVFFFCVTISNSQISAQEIEPYKSVSVSGEGVIKVVPDMATLRFGVVTRDESPLRAREKNEEISKNTLNAIRNVGIPEKNIRVEVLQLTEIREYNRETRRQETVGFQAVRSMSVILDDIEQLPEAVAQVTHFGANRIHGVTYDVKDRESIRNEALRKALLNARDKAKLMTETLDVKLGPVTKIVEQSLTFPIPYLTRAMVAQDVAAAEMQITPEAYAAGEIEVKASVQVEFRLDDTLK